MSKRIRWKKDKAETGLAAVCAAPRGYELHDGTLTYARVCPLGGGWRPLRGWYWVAGWGSSVPFINTSDAPASTAEEAKAQAIAYVREHLVVKQGGEVEQ